jgi:dCTP deaminase
MLLSYTDLHQLIEDGVIDADPQLVNSTSIDVHIGDTVLVEGSGRHSGIVDLTNKEMPWMSTFTMSEEEGFVLQPGQFVLAHTRETFNLPDDISGEFKLRSSVARAGLNHSLAGWADAGWHGAQLTLELHNALQHHSLRLRPGMRIGQMVFYRHAPVPAEGSYRTKGRYNGTKGVSRNVV